MYVCVWLIDADEFLFCPKAAQSYDTLARHLTVDVFDRIANAGFQEMRLVVLPYGAFNSTNADAASNLEVCMRKGFQGGDVQAMFRCWSSSLSYFVLSKSADLASVCPFHYNHWLVGVACTVCTVCMYVCTVCMYVCTVCMYCMFVFELLLSSVYYVL
jgi:hypothetical protein